MTGSMVTADGDVWRWKAWHGRGIDEGTCPTAVEAQVAARDALERLSGETGLPLPSVAPLTSAE